MYFKAYIANNKVSKIKYLKSIAFLIKSLLFREEENLEEFKKIEDIIEIIRISLSKFQVLEIVRSLHYYDKFTQEELSIYQNISEINEMDEETLIEEVSFERF